MSLRINGFKARGKTLQRYPGVILEPNARKWGFLSPFSRGKQRQKRHVNVAKRHAPALNVTTLEEV
jgi:hypothetical protein